MYPHRGGTKRAWGNAPRNGLAFRSADRTHACHRCGLAWWRSTRSRNTLTGEPGRSLTSTSARQLEFSPRAAANRRIASFSDTRTQWTFKGDIPKTYIKVLVESGLNPAVEDLVVCVVTGRVHYRCLRRHHSDSSVPGVDDSGAEGTFTGSLLFCRWAVRPRLTAFER